MSWLSDALGGIGHTLGTIIKNPVTDAIIGMTPLGPLGGLAAGALGGILAPGGNLGQAAQGALTGGLSGYGGSALGGLLGIGSGAGGSSGIQGLENALKNIPGAGALSGILGAVAGNGQGGIDWGKAGLLGLTAAQVVNASNLQNQSNQYAKDALSETTTNYNQRQPLRMVGMQDMLSPQIPDLSGLLANSGPYSRGLPTPSVQPVQRYTGSIGTIT